MFFLLLVHSFLTVTVYLSGSVALALALGGCLSSVKQDCQQFLQWGLPVFVQGEPGDDEVQRARFQLARLLVDEMVGDVCNKPNPGCNGHDLDNGPENPERQVCELPRALVVHKVSENYTARKQIGRRDADESQRVGFSRVLPLEHELGDCHGLEPADSEPNNSVDNAQRHLKSVHHELHEEVDGHHEPESLFILRSSSKQRPDDGRSRCICRVGHGQSPQVARYESFQRHLAPQRPESELLELRSHAEAHKGDEELFERALQWLGVSEGRRRRELEPNGCKRD